MAAQAAAEGPLERATIETKSDTARIAKDPTACPMFPYVDGDWMFETLCYVQRYLAGLVASTGQGPTKAEMGEIVFDALSGPSMRGVIMEAQADVKPFGGICPLREF